MALSQTDPPSRKIKSKLRRKWVSHSGRTGFSKRTSRAGVSMDMPRQACKTMNNDPEAQAWGRHATG